MTLIDFFILLLVAGVCGALGQAISGFSRGGCLVSIALGFIGAILGVWLSRGLGLPELIIVRSARNSECENRLFSGRFRSTLKICISPLNANRAERPNC